ncbi:MAG: ABC transporter permease [Candidatus Rokubacteria bacterium]|nr:ABC transporter permease [Candidatus Rokubacteria bacterium]
MARLIPVSGARSRSLLVGAVLVGAFGAAALLAPALAPHDPYAVPHGLEAASLRPPGGTYPLGTDLLGRDLLSRILYGARVSLGIGIGAEILAATLGVLVGLAAGFYGGRLDALLMRLTDVVMAFPSLVLAIGLMAVFQAPGLDKVFLVLVLLGWTTIARVVRAEALALKQREYVLAARALGLGDAPLIWRHLLPNAVGPLLVAATLGVAGNIVAEAGLSFLGLGAQPPTISWGAMLAEGQTFLAISPWVAIFPGLALMLTVLGINLLGDGLRDRFDPRLRI